jgi:hypothetical protein
MYRPYTGTEDYAPEPSARLILLVLTYNSDSPFLPHRAVAAGAMRRMTAAELEKLALVNVYGYPELNVGGAAQKSLALKRHRGDCQPCQHENAFLKP